VSNQSEAGSCVGKDAFDTPQAAYAVARRYKGVGHYRCDYCGKWHVGAQGK
jgi:hypothetical protein